MSKNAEDFNREKSYEQKSVLSVAPYGFWVKT